MKKAKLKDVADASGVSIATVSMVLSGKGKISQDVSQKVKEAAQALGYTRASRKSGSDRMHAFRYVAILHYETTSYLWNFSRPFITYLEELLIEKGYYPLIIHMFPQLKVKDMLQEIISSGAGAVFAVHFVNEELFDDLEQAGIPVIILNNSNFQKQYYSVLVDDIQGAYEGTSHLIELGHRNIAYAEYHRPALPAVVVDRYFGFRKAMEEHGLTFSEENKISAELKDMHALYARVREVFGRENRPTAIFAHDDYFAAFILDALKAVNLRVPEDVSIIAPGNVLDYNEPFLPKISTMQIDRKLMVKLGWELLVSRLKNPHGSVQVLKTKLPLVDRGSCRRISSAGGS